MTNRFPNEPSPSARPPGPRWTREQIRAARLAPLVPLLQKCGLELIELPAGNFELTAHPGLLIKDGYWRWPQRDLAGNAIDFFMRVLGLSFHQAMRQITGTSTLPRTDRWPRMLSGLAS